ncbi:tetratricopeptide repeat protein [Holosporaceae bacterium 'Namur']|nr:tetratricopeptide repeat protein [Holosporaceae bacterium 'Namur']
MQDKSQGTLRVELKYAANFKKALNESNLELQIESLQCLGDIYLGRKEYTRAIALYNTAFVIARDKLPIKEDKGYIEKALINCIKEAERLFLGSISLYKTISYVPHYQSGLKHKEDLKNIRQKAKDAIKEIDEEYKSKESTREAELVRAEKVKNLYRGITQDIKKFINDLIDDCQKILGDPPHGCEYAIIGLGSLAREEITPYSDFEFAILINEENENYKEYFRNLTKLLHIKVINLGETVLPTVVIDSLNPAYPNAILESWFYDNITPNGFKFDGMMPAACKTPLGKTVNNNLKEGSKDDRNKKVFELIHTPQVMAQFQAEEWYETDHLLPNELAEFTLIKWNKYDLIKLYREEIKKIHSTTVDGPLKIHVISNELPTHEEVLAQSKEKGFQKISLVKKRALMALQKDLNTFNPEITDYNTLDSWVSTFNIKKGFYRLPGVILDNLCLLFDIDKTDPWDKINGLIERDILDKEGGENYEIIFSLIKYYRLATYLHYERQEEYIDIFQYIENKKFTLSKENILEIYKLMIPLFKCAMELADNYNSITLNLNKNGIQPNLYSKERKVMQKYLNLVYGVIFLPGGSSILGHDIQRAKLNELSNIEIGDFYLRIKGYELAKAYYLLAQNETNKKINMLSNKGLSPDNPYMNEANSDLIIITDRLGKIYGVLGEKEESRNFHNVSLDLYFKVHGEDKSLSLANQYTSIAVAERQCLNVQKALKYNKKALEIRSNNDIYVAQNLLNIGSIYFFMGNKLVQEKYYRKAVSFIENNNLINVNPFLYARCCLELGKILFEKESKLLRSSIHKESKKYLEKAYKHAIEKYGEDNLISIDTKSLLDAINNKLELKNKNIDFISNYKDVSLDKLFNKAQALARKGTALDEAGQYEEGLQLKCQSLEIMQGLSHDVQIATLLFNIGNSLQHLRRYQEAFEAYEISLEIRRQIYNKEEHYDTAHSLNNAGTMLLELKRYDEALRYFDKSLEIRRKIYGEIHSDIIQSLYNLCTTYIGLGKYREGYLNSVKAINTFYYLNNKNDLSLLKLINNLINHNLNNIQDLYYTLACNYHMKAFPLAITESEKNESYFSKAKTFFKLSLNLNFNESVRLSKHEQDIYKAEILEIKLRIFTSYKASLKGRNLNSPKGNSWNFQVKILPEEIENFVFIISYILNFDKNEIEDNLVDYGHSLHITLPSKNKIDLIHREIETLRNTSIILNIITPVSQSLRFVKEELDNKRPTPPVIERNNYFTYLPIELAAYTLSFLPEAKIFNDSTLQNILQKYIDNKMVDRSNIERLRSSRGSNINF